MKYTVKIERIIDAENEEKAIRQFAEDIIGDGWPKWALVKSGNIEAKLRPLPAWAHRPEGTR